MRTVTITRADGTSVSVELDPRSTLHVTGRSRAESGSLVGGRTGVQVELRDVARVEFSDEPHQSIPSTHETAQKAGQTTWP